MKSQDVVLARAFGDEPCRMNVQGIADGSIVVYRDTPSAAIPYPRAYLYEWDDGLFAELLKAFKAGRHEALTDLWSRARFFTGTQTAH